MIELTYLDSRGEISRVPVTMIPFLSPAFRLRERGHLGWRALAFVMDECYSVAYSGRHWGRVVNGLGRGGLT